MLISMIRLKLREVFDVKKFVCCFVSVVFIFISLFVPVVSADDVENVLKGDKFTVGSFANDNVIDGIDSHFLDKIGSSIDNYYYICFGQVGCTASQNYGGTVVAYINKSDYIGEYLSFSSSSDNEKVFYNFSLNLLNFNVISFLSNGTTFNYSGHVKIDFSFYEFVENGNLSFGSASFYQNESSFTVVNAGIYTNLDISAGSELIFTQHPELTLNMDLLSLNSTFDIVAENTTDNYYDYMIYISEYSSNIGIINSFNQSKWFMSSKQWCYQWLQDYSALNGSIDDYIADNIADGIKGADILDYTFGNGMYNSLVNAWGGVFDGAKEYFSVDDETMSFYQVSQTNCPVYRINPNDTRTHTISYSSLNLELGKTYYLNIIYTPVDFKAYSAMTTPIIDAATNQGGNYPVFDTRNIAKYSVYDSYEFSVSNGVFSQDSNTFYSYSDLMKYTNPSNSVAKIESDDDEIIVSDNDSYDNSVSTEYINYGQIYHGCTFYGGSGGSGGSGGLVEENIELKIYGVDDLDFEITQLSEPVSKFKQFMQSVFGFLPEEMVGLFILGISTCIICRILGR